MKKIMFVALFMGAFALIASPGFADKVPIPKAKSEQVVAVIGHAVYQEVSPSIDMAPVTTLASFELPSIPVITKSFAEHRGRRWREPKRQSDYNKVFNRSYNLCNFVTSLDVGDHPLRC